MKKGGTGIGGGLVILIFSVVCLTIFAVLSLSSALTNKAAADKRAQMVMGYYEADTLAEYFLAEILEEGGRSGTVTFTCPVSESKELYVEAVILEDSYNILEWRLRDTADWEEDKSLPVWSGE